jgi:hypothetical protein
VVLQITPVSCHTLPLMILGSDMLHISLSPVQVVQWFRADGSFVHHFARGAAYSISIAAATQPLAELPLQHEGTDRGNSILCMRHWLSRKGKKLSS